MHREPSTGCMPGWWIKIPAAIKEDDRAIYCCRCKVWNSEKKTESKWPAAYAAYLKMFNDSENQVIDIKWINKDVFTDEPIVDVPCVLGACYAASKEYWNYLRGYEGLRLYSCEEAYISMKAWMEGGRCRLLKEIQIGHLFRDKFPYEVISKEYTYNKLVIAETLLPDEIKKRVLQAIRAFDFTDYYRSKKILDDNIQEVEGLKHYYSSHFHDGLEGFMKINDRIGELLKK